MIWLRLDFTSFAECLFCMHTYVHETCIRSFACFTLDCNVFNMTHSIVLAVRTCLLHTRPCMYNPVCPTDSAITNSQCDKSLFSSGVCI